MSMDDLKKYWRILGEAFPNVIEVGGLPDLLDEVSRFYFEGLEGIEDVEPDELFAKLALIKQDEDIVYPRLTELGSSLCTIYNSSSPAERDFSLMNFFVEKRSSRTSQLLLETKMHIKAEISNLAKSCQKCKSVERLGSSLSHCHCCLWMPSEDLLVTVRNGASRARYMEELEESRQQEEEWRILKEIREDEENMDMEKDLTAEVLKLKSRSRKIIKEKESNESKKCHEEDKGANKSKPKRMISDLFSISPKRSKK